MRIGDTPTPLGSRPFHFGERFGLTIAAPGYQIATRSFTTPPDCASCADALEIVFSYGIYLERPVVAGGGGAAS